MRLPKIMQSSVSILGAIVVAYAIVLPAVPARAQEPSPCTSNTPFPDAIKIAAPGAGAASEPAKDWPGAFEGNWEGDLPSRFVVERIDGSLAHIVYTWGDDPSGSQKAGFSRFAASLEPDGSIQWGPEAGRFVFRLDGDTAIGELRRQSQTFHATMQRCSVSTAAVPPDPSAAPAAGDPVYSGPFTGPGLANPYKCPDSNGSTEIVGEGYIMKVTGRCQKDQNFTNAGTGQLKALAMADGELRFGYKAVSGRDRLVLRAAFRVQPDPSNAVGYALRIQPESGVVALLRQPAPNQGFVIDGRSDLADRLATNDWVTIVVKADGPSLYVGIGDEVVLTAYDTTFDRGSFQFATIRIGDFDDPAETAVVLNNLQISPLAGGDPSRAPTYQQP